MRDVEPKSYVFEEVTPERMRRVDLLAQRGSDSAGAALPNNKDHVYGYRCPECSGITAVLARHVGHVRFIVDCADPDCTGEAVQEDAAPVRADEHALRGGEIHAVFFRPTEPDELAAWAAGVEAEAGVLVGEFGGDPDDEDNVLRRASQDANATRLINGHLKIAYGRPTP